MQARKFVQLVPYNGFMYALDDLGGMWIGTSMEETHQLNWQRITTPFTGR